RRQHQMHRVRDSQRDKRTGTRTGFRQRPPPLGRPVVELGEGSCGFTAAGRDADDGEVVAALSGQLMQPNSEGNPAVGLTDRLPECDRAGAHTVSAAVAANRVSKWASRTSAINLKARSS